MKIRSSKQAFADTQRLAAMFPGIVAVLNDFSDVASVEQAADAAEARLKTAQDELAAARNATIAAQDAKAQAAIEHQAALAQMQQEQAEKLASNKIEADAIINEANDKAATIKQQADAQAAAAVDAVQSKLNASNTQIDAAQGSLDAAAAEYVARRNEIAQATQVRDGILNEIAALKAKLG